MLEYCNRIIGGATPAAVLLVGGLLAVRLRGLPFTRSKDCLAALRTPNRGGESPLRSLFLALAGTLGVGNIVGVSSAIALGGPGAVFWMWVSALFAMFLKYAEVVLALIFRETRPDGTFRGGAPYYIRAVLSRHISTKAATVAACVFAILCLANGLMMGCTVQANAVASALSSSFGVPPLLCGGILAVLCIALLTKGRRAISTVTGVLVPFMSGAFLLLTLTLLILRRDCILPALRTILSDAFSPSAAGGGLLGFVLSRGVRFGTVRGIISNEAGCGTSPTAHAAANTKSPVEQGLFGIVEVAVDTLLLCTVTALAVIIGGAFTDALPTDSMAMTLRAYSAALGGAVWVEKALSITIACFGFATLLCWAHYSTEALHFLGAQWKRDTIQDRTAPWFFAVFSLCALLGCVSAPSLIWSLTDLVTGLMTLFNSGVLTIASPNVVRATREYFHPKT